MPKYELHSPIVEVTTVAEHEDVEPKVIVSAALLDVTTDIVPRVVVMPYGESGPTVNIAGFDGEWPAYAGEDLAAMLLRANLEAKKMQEAEDG